jgi:hypothetical protein
MHDTTCQAPRLGKSGQPLLVVVHYVIRSKQVLNTLSHGYPALKLSKSDANIGITAVDFGAELAILLQNVNVPG